jgi:hypothetical protein
VSLITLLAHQFEVIIGKLSIIAVKVLDLDAVHDSKLFKCSLVVNCFQQGEIAGHEINELELEP